MCYSENTDFYSGTVKQIFQYSTTNSSVFNKTLSLKCAVVACSVTEEMKTLFSNEITLLNAVNSSSYFRTLTYMH